jgi:phospholipase D1/2
MNDLPDLYEPCFTVLLMFSVALNMFFFKVPPTNDRGGPSESEEGSGLGHDDGISVESTKEGQEDVGDASHHGLDSKTYYRKPAKGTEAFERWEREELLHELNGHLGTEMPFWYAFVRHEPNLIERFAVIFPTRFLEGEDAANNFLFNADR